MKVTKKQNVAAKDDRETRARRIVVNPRNKWVFKKKNSTVRKIAERIEELDLRYYGEVMNLVMSSFGLNHNVVSDLMLDHNVFRVADGSQRRLV